MYEHILVSEADGILTITLNRPDRLNAFIGHMRRDLAEALEHAGSDRSVRVVIITGAGRAFCAGGDIAFMAELMQRRDAEEFSRILGAGPARHSRDSANDQTRHCFDQWSSFRRGL